MFDIAMTLEGFMVEEDYAYEGIKDIGKAIGGAFTKGLQKVKGWFTKLWDTIRYKIRNLMSSEARAQRKEDKIRNRDVQNFIERVLPQATKIVEQGFAKLTGAKSNRQMLDRWGDIEPKVKRAVESAKEARSKVKESYHDNIYSPRTCAKLLAKIEANKSSIDKIISTAEQCIRETSQNVPNKFKTTKDAQAPSEGSGELGGNIGSKLVAMISDLQPLYSTAVSILQANDAINKNDAANREQFKADKKAAKTARKAAKGGSEEPATDSWVDESLDSWYF